MLGTAVLTMVYQPEIDLASIWHGWEIIIMGAGVAALIAAPLVIWWHRDRDALMERVSSG